jgi:hypothetical protein
MLWLPLGTSDSIQNVPIFRTQATPDASNKQVRAAHKTTRHARAAYGINTHAGAVLSRVQQQPE